MGDSGNKCSEGLLLPVLLLLLVLPLFPAEAVEAVGPDTGVEVPGADVDLLTLTLLSASVALDLAILNSGMSTSMSRPWAESPPW